MHLGVIGNGNIATELIGFLARPGAPEVARVTMLVRPGCGLRAVQCDRSPAIGVVESVADLIEARPGLVVECAGHSGVAEHVPAVLEAGIDVVTVSVGALADDALASRVKAAAALGGARVILPAGAVGGIDLLAALSQSGGVEVSYRGTKPPGAWAGTAAETLLDLDRIEKATVFFRGTAREAAINYPKNANVAATLALAGPGLDATRVELAADPDATGNTHRYEVRSAAANYSIEIESRPSPGNARTSVSTIYSVIREIRNRIGPMVI